MSKLKNEDILLVEYVLMTDQDIYFVEYLFNDLILSDSISEAMIFKDYQTALKFKEILQLSCNLKTTISTFIA